MRFTIIPDDKTVIVDGVARRFDFEVNENLRAAHWDDDAKVRGRMEMHKGGVQVFETTAEFNKILKQHAAILQEESDERAAVEKEYNLPENKHKREIQSIEGTITPRRIREAILTDDGKAWLSSRESEIEALRAKLRAIETKKKASA